MILSDFISVSQVFLAALVTCSLAEPPALSQSYGLPEVSTGYSYQPSSHETSHGTDYVEQHVGHQTSEGLHLDQNLLHKIEHVLVHHENSNPSAQIISVPSSGYGLPQSTYGPPSHHQHWSAPSKVVGIDFGHLRQSHQVAQYLGQSRYAPSYHTGWSSGNSGWNAGWQSGNSHSGWQLVKPSSGWQSANSGWQSGASSGWAAPAKPSGWTQSGWTAPAKPSGWIAQSQPSGWEQSGWNQPSIMPRWAAKPASGLTLARPSISYGLPSSW